MIRRILMLVLAIPFVCLSGAMLVPFLLICGLIWIFTGKSSETFFINGTSVAMFPVDMLFKIGGLE